MARARKDAVSIDGGTPKAAKPPPRAQCTAVVERYLKQGQTIYWAREMATWSRLWKLYPDLAFWMGYELPFGEGIHGLNMMSWFEGEEGAADLARAWLLYRWVPPEAAAEPPSPPDGQPSMGAPLDDAAPSQLSYPIAPRKPRTVAEWLRR